MRGLLVTVHRWLGLFMAVFLAIAGLTGAIISWDHELDAWLNPAFYQAKSGQGRPRDSLTLANELEQRDPRLLVSYVPLGVEPGETLMVFADGRIDPKTGKAFDLGFNQMGLDPVSGEVQAKRLWGEVSLSRENLLPFLYKLHYSLHIPAGFGVELGTMFMGIVAIVWVIDAFVALWIAFPSRKSWKKSFAFRLRQGRYKLNFDLHRSGGVWVWALLLVLAVTAVSMNLRREVMLPIVSLFSEVTPSPFNSRTPNPPDQPIEPKLSREEALARARSEAARRGITAPAGGVAYASEFGVYAVGFFETGHDHGDGSLGNPWLYIDGQTGAPAGADIPGTGTAGDTFMQAQFPLHSGRIFGVAGRAVVSLLGLVVTMLSVTGIVIWARKRRARRFRAKSEAEAMEQPVLATIEESVG